VPFSKVLLLKHIACVCSLEQRTSFAWAKTVSADVQDALHYYVAMFEFTTIFISDCVCCALTLKQGSQGCSERDVERRMGADHPKVHLAYLL
jgi:hypothetical protein